METHEEKEFLFNAKRWCDRESVGEIVKRRLSDTHATALPTRPDRLAGGWLLCSTHFLL